MFFGVQVTSSIGKSKCNSSASSCGEWVVELVGGTVDPTWGFCSNALSITCIVWGATFWQLPFEKHWQYNLDMDHFHVGWHAMCNCCHLLLFMCIYSSPSSNHVCGCNVKFCSVVSSVKTPYGQPLFQSLRCIFPHSHSFMSYLYTRNLDMQHTICHVLHCKSMRVIWNTLWYVIGELLLKLILISIVVVGNHMCIYNMYKMGKIHIWSTRYAHYMCA